MKNLVICGGGIAGLMAALIISKRNIPNRNIILIEREEQIGGLLKSFNYEEAGVFDYGIHTIYDTGIRELDDQIFQILQPEEWVINSGYMRDFGGAYINGKLQSNSVYVDLRNLKKNIYEKCVDDFFENFNTLKYVETKSSEDLFRQKYGDFIYDNVMNPIVKKVFNKDSSEMSQYIVKLLQLDRVIAFGQSSMLGLQYSESLRSHLAFPNQLNYPEKYLPNKKSIYPRKYGMYNFINSLKKVLVKRGVKILTSTQIEEIEVNNNEVTSLLLTSNNSKSSSKVESIECLLWAAPLPILGNLLKIKNKFKFDKGYSTAFFNILLNEKPNVKELFFIYFFDPEFISHRIACPSSFCPESYSDGNHRLSIEIILDQERMNLCTEEKIINELISARIIKKDMVVFSKLEKIEGGYFCPSLNNVNAISFVRNELLNKKIKNIETLGIMSRPDLFFQTDVLRDVFHRFKNF